MGWEMTQVCVGFRHTFRKFGTVPGGRRHSHNTWLCPLLYRNISREWENHEDTKRFCTTCSRDVYRVTSDHDLEENFAQGRMVAFDYQNVNSSPYVSHNSSGEHVVLLFDV